MSSRDQEKAFASPDDDVCHYTDAITPADEAEEIKNAIQFMDAYGNKHIDIIALFNGVTRALALGAGVQVDECDVCGVIHTCVG